MPSQLRVRYPGAIYHLMNRGDRRDNIFADDQDRQRFLTTLAEAGEKTGRQVHAYCLMSNHFHLVAERRQVHTSIIARIYRPLTTHIFKKHRIYPPLTLPDGYCRIT